MNEPRYVWSEEPPGWGPAERATFDRMMRALIAEKRLAVAISTFQDGDDDLLDSTTLLVEVATVLTAKGFGHPAKVVRQRSRRR